MIGVNAAKFLSIWQKTIIEDAAVYSCLACKLDR